MFDALYIGRFQPFHNGHLHALKSILDDNESVIIALGSADKSFEKDNPLRIEEREEIIEGVLKAEGIDHNRYILMPVDDIGDDERWVKHVEMCLPPFKRIYSGTPLVQDLFKKDGSHEVLDVSFLEGHNATMVRERVLSGEDYSDLIYGYTREYLERIGFKERMEGIVNS